MSIFTRSFNTDGLNVPGGPFVLNRDSPQAQGLIRFWPFQIPGGTKLHGLTGNEKAVTFGSSITGSSWKTTPFNGYALTGILQTPNSFIDINEEINFEDFTIAIWARPTFAFDAGFFPGLFGNTNNSADDGIFLLYRTNDDFYRFAAHRTGALATCDSAVITSDAELGRNRFNLFVGGTSDGDHFFDINGVEQATSSQTGAFNNAARDMYLLSNNGFTNLDNGHWGGDVFHVAMWNHRISDGLRSHLYHPDTRWDLYHRTGKVSYFSLPAAVAVGGPRGPLGHPLHGPFGGPI